MSRVTPHIGIVGFWGALDRNGRRRSIECDLIRRQQLPLLQMLRTEGDGATVARVSSLAPRSTRQQPCDFALHVFPEIGNHAWSLLQMSSVEPASDSDEKSPARIHGCGVRRKRDSMRIAAAQQVSVRTPNKNGRTNGAMYLPPWRRHS